MTAARSRHAALSGSQAKAPGFAGGYLLLADRRYAPDWNEPPGDATGCRVCRPSVAAQTEGVQNKRRGITLRHVARRARPTRAGDRVSDDSWGRAPVDPVAAGCLPEGRLGRRCQWRDTASRDCPRA